MICSTRAEKKALNSKLHSSIWIGRVGSALKALEACRPHTKNEQRLQELIDYLKARNSYIVNYNERRLNRQYMGSAHTEKACDLIVAKRQKNKGMYWSEATADALAETKTVMLNRAWDLYRVDREILPLATTP
ncbi:hypothetical protein C1752_13119 [Acaryochloris thomasi RCC1774]|uniref:Transposase n=1 Tax=Acaryochloris thomasi RCC1774 TaxID=1764569 RepID=A0A2W1J7B1_9CYAN|nr:hypothetical protein C1752_13119 [Acaryochloris thomasi RCC1774]